jgi:L-ascorbate metabolism protein UlaG (beta-lactamase superfamily)
MKNWMRVAMTMLLLAANVALAQPAPPAQRLELPSAPSADQADNSVQFVGTATVIIRMGGITILTDPNFLHKGEKVHLGYGLTATRLTDPAMNLEALPPIDLVILSHFHEDHFDRLVQQKLDRNLPIVTNAASAEQLRKLGFKRATGLATWGRIDIVKGDTTLTATAMPGRHGPLAVAALLPDVMGTMLEWRRAAAKPYRMYISGDTMVYGDIEEIPKRYPDIDLALLHLGGTRILGVVTVTMDAGEGLRMLQLIAPQRAIPIHYDDYDRFKSPLSDFQKAVNEAGLANKVSYLKRGETYRIGGQ